MNSSRDRSAPPASPRYDSASSATDPSAENIADRPDVLAAVDELLHIQGRLLYAVTQLTTAFNPVTRAGPSQQAANTTRSLAGVPPELRGPLAMTLQDVVSGVRLLVDQIERLSEQLEL